METLFFCMVIYKGGYHYTYPTISSYKPSTKTEPDLNFDSDSVGDFGESQTTATSDSEEHEQPSHLSMSSNEQQGQASQGDGGLSAQDKELASKLTHIIESANEKSVHVSATAPDF